MHSANVEEVLKTDLASIYKSDGKWLITKKKFSTLILNCCKQTDWVGSVFLFLWSSYMPVYQNYMCKYLSGLWYVCSTRRQTQWMTTQREVEIPVKGRGRRSKTTTAAAAAAQTEFSDAFGLGDLFLGKWTPITLVQLTCCERSLHALKLKIIIN